VRRRRLPAVAIVFELAGTSGDAERWLATGWRDSRLSPAGKRQAVELGERRAEDEIAAVYCSDLACASETARIAFGSGTAPVLHDWRLRECDFGDLTGGPVAQVEKVRTRHVYEPFPGGESYADVVARVRSFLRDVGARSADRRILVIGHHGTKVALDHVLEGAPLPELVEAALRWQPGWMYALAVDH